MNNLIEKLFKDFKKAAAREKQNCSEINKQRAEEAFQRFKSAVVYRI